MTSMYRLKKQVEVPNKVELPSCMYKMEALNRVSGMDLSSSYYGPTRASQKSEDVSSLEVRQEALLERLQHLRQQLDHLLGNKVVTSNPNTTLHSVVGAATHSSPVKMGGEEKQAEVEQVVARVGDHLAHLNSLQHNFIAQQDKDGGMETDVGRLQDSVLYRLGCLKAELQCLSETDEDTFSAVESVGLAERQCSILKIIKVLKEEVEFLAELQKKTDPKDWPSEVDVVTHHREVVKKLKLLQEELAKMLRGLQDLSWETTSVHDLVISANPNAPPFSLVLLRKLLKEVGCPVFSVNHLHSSVLEVNDVLRSCFIDCPMGDRNKHKVAFTLHWKDVPAPCLMVNPLRQTQISGEANILRYISRLFPLSSQYNYEASGTFMIITETDQLMDQLSKQIACGNNKERQAALRQLNGRLGKTIWLMGNTCSIVDVLTWSLMRQAQLSVSAPANLAKWYMAMTTLAGLDKETEVQEPQPCVNTDTSGSRESSSTGPSNTAHKSKTCLDSKERTKDGSQKTFVDRTGLETHLKQLSITYQVQDHEEVFTVDALMQHVRDMPGLHMKNLFLKDKKKNLYLLSARHNAEVKLNEIGKQIGVKDLRFGDEDTMFSVLGVKQGCVTAYALINDTNRQVQFLVDQEALSVSHPYVNFHPMSNAATLGISPNDLSKFLTSTGHEPTLLTLK
ncbi:uncharacterized protein LOC121864473 isoform X1 [Homarus americanus]|uniref:uncharacterized protein LOC121864473 isoform X1 n=1 Tax=Homarus americanus TaxID=6706 RepID=UPI001C491551|nr:uncharacterized protein LOC121864473 isoform X1 [Homarus americanus]